MQLSFSSHGSSSKNLDATLCEMKLENALQWTLCLLMVYGDGYFVSFA